MLVLCEPNFYTIYQRPVSGYICKTATGSHPGPRPSQGDVSPMKFSPHLELLDTDTPTHLHSEQLMECRRCFGAISLSPP